MNWLKNNWFKLIIAAIIILIGFSIFYYSIVFLPQKERIRLEQQKQSQLIEKQEKNIERQEKCREAGTKTYDYYKKNNSLSTGYFFDPEFHFNEKLQLCLYSGGYSQDDYWERFVKNAYSDEEIILFNKIQSVRTDLYDSFWGKYKELFEQ